MRPPILMNALCAACLLLVAASCAATNLPETRPDDLTIRLYASAGMIPESFDFQVSTSQCGIVSINRGQTTITSCTATSAQLDALYQVLRENAFDQIETYEQEAYDRGGTSISLSFGGQYLSIDDGGNTWIAERSQEAWRHVYEAVHALMTELSAAATVHVPLSNDGSAAGQDIMLHLDTALAFPYGNTIDLVAPPGPHVLVIQDHYQLERSTTQTIDFQPGRTAALSLDAQGGFVIEVH